MTTVELRPAPDPAGESDSPVASKPVDVAGEPVAARTVRRYPPVGFGLALVLRASLTLSALLIGFVVYLLLLAPLQQARTQSVLYAQLREGLATATTPIQGLIEPGTPIAALQIPGITLDQVVVEGTAASDLQTGPGHRRNTALPGQQGVSLLYGRSSTYGAPFALITQLQAGDPITVVTGQGQFTYAVQQVRRDGDPLPSPLPAGGSRLTLASADNDRSGGQLGAGSTVYVDALLVTGQAQPAGQRPGLIPPYEQAMRGDTGALVPMVLWLQVLVLVSAAITWARRRWGRWQTWVVAVPTVLLATWQLYDAAARLLPNLL